MSYSHQYVWSTGWIAAGNAIKDAGAGNCCKDGWQIERNSKQNLVIKVKEFKSVYCVFVYLFYQNFSHKSNTSFRIDDDSHIKKTLSGKLIASNRRNEPLTCSIVTSAPQNLFSPNQLWLRSKWWRTDLLN